MSGGIFISYRREDSAGYARAIYDRVSSRMNRERIFFDVDNIEPGLDFVQVLSDRVGGCDALVAIIGKQWINVRDGSDRRRIDDPRDFVRIEIEAALRRGIRVIPVLLDGAPMPSPDELPEGMKALANRQALEISHTRFDSDADRLTRWLTRVDAAAATEKTPVVVPPPPAKRGWTVPAAGLIALLVLGAGGAAYWRPWQPALPPLARTPIAIANDAAAPPPTAGDLEKERTARFAAAEAQLQQLKDEAALAEKDRLAREARAAEAARAEKERLAAELAAKEKARQDEAAAREAALAEKDRLAKEAQAKADAMARAAEAAKAEQDRVAAELAAKEKARQDEAAAREAALAETNRLAKEAQAKAEALAGETAAAKAERDRLAAELATREKARLEAEAVAAAQAEKERLASDAAARAETDRLAQSKAASPAVVADPAAVVGDATKVALVDPSVALVAPPAPFLADPIYPVDFALAAPIQAQLRRLGCFEGADGDWSSASVQDGLSRYAKHTASTGVILLPRLDLLVALSRTPARVCPLECGLGQVPNGDHCAPKVLPAAAKPVAAVRPAPKPAYQPPVHHAAPAAAPSSSNCFSFNGARYCQ